MAALVCNITQQGRLRDMHSLRIVDPDFNEGPQRFFVFHTLGNGLDTHYAADSLDGLDDGAIDRVGADVPYEAPSIFR